MILRTTFGPAVLLLSAAAFFVPLAPAPAAAQPPAGPGPPQLGVFGQCLNDAAEAQVAAQGSNPSAPADGSTEAFLSADQFLADSWVCALDVADRLFIPTSRALLWSLAIVFTVWQGVMMMFGRGPNLASLLNYLMLIGFALIVLDNYYRPQHGLFPADMGFVQVIATQVVDWANEIYRTTEADFDRAFGRSRRILDASATAAEVQFEADRGLADEAAGSGGAQGFVKRAFDAVVALIVVMLVGSLQLVVSFVLWCIRWVLVAQYMWGYFMLTILSVMGPLFVPAIVIPQIDWLFWNWLRGLIGACVYMLTAAALYAVSMLLLLTPLARINQAVSVINDPSAGVGAALLWLVSTFFEYIPIVALVIYMSVQAGTLAGGLMSGTGPSSLLDAASVVRKAGSYTAGAAPVLASGLAQRGAQSIVMAGAAYHGASALAHRAGMWLTGRQVGGPGPGAGGPGGGGADTGGGGPGPGGGGPGGSGPGPGGPGPAGGGPDTADAASGFGSGDGGAGVPHPRFGGLDAVQRAAAAAHLSALVNSAVDRRVDARLREMGGPSAGGGARERLRDVERFTPVEMQATPSGTYEMASDQLAAGAEVSADPVRARERAVRAGEAARIVFLQRALLWDDAPRVRTGASAIGPAGDAGGDSMAAAAAAQAAAETGKPSSSAGRHRIADLGTGFESRVRDGVRENILDPADAAIDRSVRRVGRYAGRKAGDAASWARERFNRGRRGGGSTE